MTVADEGWRPPLAPPMQRRPLLVAHRLGRPNDGRDSRVVELKEGVLVGPESRPALESIRLRDLERWAEAIDRRRRVALEAGPPGDLGTGNAAWRLHEDPQRTGRRGLVAEAVQQLLGPTVLAVHGVKVLDVPDQSAVTSPRHRQSHDPPVVHRDPGAAMSGALAKRLPERLVHWQVAALRLDLGPGVGGDLAAWRLAQRQGQSDQVGRTERAYHAMSVHTRLRT